MASLVKAQWIKSVTNAALQRSSHCVSVVGDIGYVFGGELLPRQPRDNDVFTVGLAGKDHNVSTLNKAQTAPSPRVGAPAASIHDHVYVFSGRGGEAMTPVEENGAVWSLDTSTSTWSLLEPSEATKSFPQARSYHCSTSDGSQKIYIHAGCPAKGRLSDLWSFEPAKRTWTQLADAPGSVRGGTSIAYHQGRIYRMNGFDGQKELGGSLDVFDVATSSWSTIAYEADGSSGPWPRSVSALLPVSIDGKPKLVTLFGESNPSSLGHAGAGKMLGDVWVFDIESKKWGNVSIQPGERSENPAPRGWFDASVYGSSTIFVSGGLGETNERLSDAWLLKF